MRELILCNPHQSRTGGVDVNGTGLKFDKKKKVSSVDPNHSRLSHPAHKLSLVLTPPLMKFDQIKSFASNDDASHDESAPS